MLVNGDFRAAERTLIRAMLNAPVIDRITWHAQAAPAPTRELTHVRVMLKVPDHIHGAIREVRPNIPWAEDQFQERIGGVPLNPPPSHEWWPYAEKHNAVHTEAHGGQFSHTYPERMWPQFAGHGLMVKGEGIETYPRIGIRFRYGDFNDLLAVLVENPLTRQAYLPIWHPEDLAAAVIGERVPCSLGYHFLLQADDTMDIDYTIRSCDFRRHFRDDVYMTMRLLQHVCEVINVPVGRLYMNIGSLHCFPPDEAILKELL